MKRRDAIRMVPLSLAGMAGMARQGFGEEVNWEKRWPGNGEPLAVEYSRKIRERLSWIRANQSENLMEGAYAIARTVESGGQCYQTSWDAGHTEADSWPGRNGEPEIFSTRFNLEKANTGDLILTSGQLREAEAVKKKGICIVGTTSPWSGDARYTELLRDEVKALTLRPYADIFIENQATTLGGVVMVPGMPAPVGPVSGITGKTTIWMMLADACRILSRKGVSRPVKGDEPKVTGATVDYKSFTEWVKPSEPLMDNYFNEVMRQLEMVFAEYGTIKKIAAMAVDAATRGGIVYGYSRYNSIAGEASTRRSGISLTRGVYGSQFTDAAKRKGFPGTPKDCVIMGITKPDDELDLAMLDLFRSRGMKVASLGPMTRSIAVPKGKTVPKESDLHAGRMCDTYGLFAVPGFEQRICPTSGVVLDHLFWVTMMETVQQFIERTGGDVPGMYFSAALNGGREHMHRMNELFVTRGY
ncbi:MAG: hypothetical protein ACYC9O_09900 [Candidatus Latescibacterota bacterium]